MHNLNHLRATIAERFVGNNTINVFEYKPGEPGKITNRIAFNFNQVLQDRRASAPTKTKALVPDFTRMENMLQYPVRINEMWRALLLWTV